MQFESLQALLHMGGHGPYVWTAYAIFFVTVAANSLLAYGGRKRALRQVERLLRRDEVNP